ncbi:hypothetical protein N7541_009503 [Penicillium brevicompactum]|uniref:Uncharacterized protein n=1 Tax=Penicillium brevicompactum TaxID=5074 RepID=A0A9W9QPU0_PENBR|nr:hypothetical protein N7541_009503 [Penicillium brevicompactum]
MERVKERQSSSQYRQRTTGHKNQTTLRIALQRAINGCPPIRWTFAARKMKGASVTTEKQ